MFHGLQQLFIDVITNGLMGAGIALGFLLILRGTGVFNVAYGAVFIGAGYIFAALYVGVGWPFIIAAAVTSAAMAALVALMDRGFRVVGGMARHSAEERSLVASLGLALILENACGWAFGSDVKSVSKGMVSLGYVIHPAAMLFGMAMLAATVYFAFRRSGKRTVLLGALLGMAVLGAVAVYNSPSGILPRGRLAVASVSLVCLLAVEGFMRSAPGARWRAYLSSPATARLRGYRSERYRLSCAMAGGVSIGLISSAYVENSGIRPDESWHLLIGAAFVALLANRISGSLLVLAGIVYALASYVAVLMFSSAWQNVVTCGLLFALLVVKSRRFDAESSLSEG